MTSNRDKVRQSIWGNKELVKEVSYPSGFLVESSEDGKVDLEEIRELIYWRMGFLCGYCAETHEPHHPDDFHRSEGILNKLGITDTLECERCGLSVTQDRYQRLIETSELRENLETSTKTLEIHLEGKNW